MANQTLKQQKFFNLKKKELIWKITSGCVFCKKLQIFDSLTKKV